MDDFLQKFLNDDEKLMENSEESENTPTEEIPTEEETNNTDNEPSIPEVDENSTLDTEETKEPIEADSFNEDFHTNNDTFNYNPINYTPVTPHNDYKPMSKGLKVFAGIMAAVILLTGSCLAGYFVGRNSGGIVTGGKTPAVDLAARPTKTDQMTAAQVYEEVNKSIVGIVVYNSLGNASQASGIVFSKDGYIVTNDHIYSEIGSPKFKIYTHDGKQYDAKFVAGDVISDLAVLKVDTSELTPATFADSNQLFYGENVVAIGRPSDATANSSITDGIISATSRRVTTTSNYSARLIQTTCAINPGSSGGALANMYGQVVGVTSSKLVSTAYDNVGYAIPTTIMKRIVDELISEGKVVSRAKLGITYTLVDSITAEIQNYNQTGLLIASVAEDSGLYGKAEKDDIITHINGIEITDDEIVLDIIEEAKAGDKIQVTIVTSSGTQKTIEAELKANTSESSYSDKVNEAPSQNGGEAFNFPEGE